MIRILTIIIPIIKACQQCEGDGTGCAYSPEILPESAMEGVDINGNAPNKMLEESSNFLREGDAGTIRMELNFRDDREVEYIKVNMAGESFELPKSFGEENSPDDLWLVQKEYKINSVKSITGMALSDVSNLFILPYKRWKLEIIKAMGQEITSVKGFLCRNSGSSGMVTIEMMTINKGITNMVSYGSIVPDNTCISFDFTPPRGDCVVYSMHVGKLLPETTDITVNYINWKCGSHQVTRNYYVEKEPTFTISADRVKEYIARQVTEVNKLNGDN